MSIEIVSKNSAELDFFADMTPQVKTKTSEEILIESLGGTSQGSSEKKVKVEEVTSAQSKMSFAMADTAATDVSCC